MKQDIVTLPLASDCTLRLEFLECPLSEYNWDSSFKIILHRKQESDLLLFDNTADMGIESANASITYLLKNGLDLHPSLGKDIGFLWNCYLNRDVCSIQHHSLEFVMRQGQENHTYWVGEDYWLWESPDGTTTWLYEKDERIYLEVTPVYSGCMSESDEENASLFEKYMQHYKPIFKTIIERSIVKVWHKEFTRLSQLLDENQKKVFASNVRDIMLAPRNAIQNPKDGQRALDNSVIGHRGDLFHERIGVSAGEIVIMIPDPDGAYHGHVTPWEELTPKNQCALIMAGLVDTKGNM